MPNPLGGITDATLNDLKINATDALKLRLLFEKTPGNPAQTVDLQALATTYNTTDDRLSAAIKALEAAKAVQANYSTITLTWRENPTPSTTAAQLQSNWNSRFLDDPTYYVYEALILTKPPGLTQQIDPAVFSAAPWNIPPATLISEIQRLAAFKPTTNQPNLVAPFDADFANVTLTWLTQNIGNAA